VESLKICSRGTGASSAAGPARPATAFHCSTLTIDGGRPTAPNVSTIDDTPALGAPATTICTSWTERMMGTGVSRSDGAVCGSAFHETDHIFEVLAVCQRTDVIRVVLGRADP